MAPSLEHSSQRLLRHKSAETFGTSFLGPVKIQRHGSGLFPYWTKSKNKAPGLFPDWSKSKTRFGTFSVPVKIRKQGSGLMSVQVKKLREVPDLFPDWVFLCAPKCALLLHSLTARTLWHQRVVEWSKLAGVQPRVRHQAENFCALVPVESVLSAQHQDSDKGVF